MNAELINQSLFAQIIGSLGSTVNRRELEKLVQSRLTALARPHWHPFVSRLKELPTNAVLLSRGDFSYDFSQAVVSIGRPHNLQGREPEQLNEAIEELIPWRKGPFNLFGVAIDAEWRSDLKWARIAPYLDPLSGLRVADLGASTGYYMLRLAEQKPAAIIGFEPAERCLLTWTLLERFLALAAASMTPLGAEHLQLFDRYFDVVLCMGLVYHQRDPIGLLRSLSEGMRSGGQIIVESMAIPGVDQLALFAADRYAKLRNVYFVPTPGCLAAWITKAGFGDVEIFSIEQLTNQEQRRTKYAPGESLDDFLDPQNRDKTVEGYPAPLRVAVKARAR